MHQMLTEITALRSTAEILADPQSLDPGQRRRFEGIVNEQSARLVASGRALVAHFDRLADGRLPRAAVEEAEEFLHRSGAVDAVEAAGARLRAELTAGGRDLEQALSLAAPLATPPSRPDWGRTRRLAALAEAHAGAVAAPEVAAALAGCSEAALPHARAALLRRLADAIRFPADRFAALGARLGWDVDALVAATDGDSGLVFRRVADLHRAGRAPLRPRHRRRLRPHAGPRAARSTSLPRARALDCPVWPLHRAAGPRARRAPLVALSGGGSRRVVAAPPPRRHGARTCWSSTRPPSPASGEPPLAVGTSCRICAHRDCPQRREPSVLEP